MSINEEDQVNYFHEASFTDENGQVRTTKVPVVQELARQRLNHFPKRFIAMTDQSGNHLLETPPVIDMMKLRGEERGLELARLGEVAKEWGLFLIKRHGIEDRVLDDVKDVVKGFFGLSFEEKRANVGTYKSMDNMGYGKNFVKSEDQPLDWIDRLTMKAAPKDQETEGLVVWPQKPANFRQAVQKYVHESRKVLNELLQDLAESISLDRCVFLEYFEPTQSEIKVRVNCYPPCPRPDLAVGIMPHSDASALTLLLEFETTKGLQVLRGTNWTTLHWPDDNSLLVNFGDLLEIMSNGVLKSPWHRVQTQLNAERFTLAYFYNPPAHTKIEPVEGEGLGDKRYKKVMVEEYISNYYKNSPTATKEAIMFSKFK